MKDQVNNSEMVVNRDISWLEFNARVLEEAMDEGNPLLERLKFLAIFSSNLDEFFMVRIAGICRQPKLTPQKLYKGQSYLPMELLAELTRKIRTLTARQYRYLNTELLPALQEYGIHLVSWEQLDASRQIKARECFEQDILPVLTPIGIDPSHPFPLLPNLELELLIRLHGKNKKDAERFAVIEVPKIIPRFLPLSDEQKNTLFLPIEDLIANNLTSLFSGSSVLECHPFRITRDMDFFIDEESVADLLTEMQTTLQNNSRRRIVRLEVSNGMSSPARQWLMDKLQISGDQVYPIAGPLNLKSFFGIDPGGICAGIERR